MHSPPSHSDHPARLGDFGIEGVLGEGGSGVVYRARWGPRVVALKVLRASLVPSDSQRKRFFDEAGVLAGTEHPGVVKVLGFGELPDGRPYLAMELLEGETLSARLARGPLPVAEALALFDQLAAAVQALHDGGLVHRDLKPENVFLVPGPEVPYAMLLDFGIAKDADGAPSTVTEEGYVRGTPAYMAPERFFGQAAGASTDLYELAVVLFAMLTGRLPWADTADPNGRLNPARPSELGVALPGAMETELMRALSTRVESRPATVAELAQRVRDAAGAGGDDGRRTLELGGAPRETKVPTARDASPRRRSSRWKWAVAIAAGAAVGGAVAVWAATRGGGEPAAAVVPEPVVEAADAAPAPAPAPAPWSPPSGEAGAVPAIAWRHHPSETRVLIGVAWRDILRSPLYRDTRRHFATPELEAVAAEIDKGCAVDVLDTVRWMTLGVALDSELEFDLAIAGDWPREQALPCLRSLLAWSGEKGAVTDDGDHVRITISGGSLLVGWPAHDTMLLTNREAADAAWMDRRAAGKGGVERNELLRGLRGSVDMTATIWFVGAPVNWMDEPLIPGMPPPMAVYGSLDIDDVLDLRIGLRYRTGVQAAAAHKAVSAAVDKLKRDEPLMTFVTRDMRVEQKGNDVVLVYTPNAELSRVVAKGLVDTIKMSL